MLLRDEGWGHGVRSKKVLNDLDGIWWTCGKGGPFTLGWYKNGDEKMVTMDIDDSTDEKRQTDFGSLLEEKVLTWNTNKTLNPDLFDQRSECLPIPFLTCLSEKHVLFQKSKLLSNVLIQTETITPNLYWSEAKFLEVLLPATPVGMRLVYILPLFQQGPTSSVSSPHCVWLWFLTTGWSASQLWARIPPSNPPSSLTSTPELLLCFNSYRACDDNSYHYLVLTMCQEPC